MGIDKVRDPFTNVCHIRGHLQRYVGDSTCLAGMLNDFDTTCGVDTMWSY